MGYLIEGTEGQKHISYLDGWRGIAILLVLCGHFSGLEYNFGPMGVNFFFALSGLLMGRILFIDKVSLEIFYRNRIARIFPVFYLYIVVILIIALINKIEIHSGEFVYSALFLRTYFGGSSIWNDDVPFGHLWSLNVEEHCYILLSVISLFAFMGSRAYARVAVTICALVCFAFFGIYKIFPPVSESPIFLRSECAGFAILSSTAIFLWLRHWREEVPSYVPVVSAIMAMVVGTVTSHGFTKFILPQVLLAISVNTLAYAPAWLRNALGNRVLVWFGVCSFSIYMWQQPFFLLVQHTEVAYLRCFAFAIALCIGALSFYYYEQPMRRWIHSFKFATPEDAYIALPRGIKTA